MSEEWGVRFDFEAQDCNGVAMVCSNVRSVDSQFHAERAVRRKKPSVGTNHRVVRRQDKSEEWKELK